MNNEVYNKIMQLNLLLSYRRRRTENAYIFGLIAIAISIAACAVCGVVYILTK